MLKIDYRQLKKSTAFWIIFISFVFSMIIIAFGDNLFDSLKPLSVRLLVAFTLFFGALIVLLVRQLYFRNYTTNEMVENAHIRSLEAANAHAVKSRVDLLKEQFSHALNVLKNSSVYKGKRESQYELPWYFVMGEQGEGKTSLIQASGLDFPLHTNGNSMPDERDDNSFHWYFTDDAVLIDIDGKYLQNETGSIDAGVWKAFLKLFKKRRWKRPINGIILTLSVDTLLQKSDADLEAYAKQLRDRFDELTVAFTSIIPIYLFITKSDRITGFQEYFSTLSRNEKDEILGITFADNVSMDKTIAQNEFNAMLKRLDGSLLDRIHSEWDNSARTKVLLFGDELSDVFEKIQTFIETGFASTRYRAPLMLRGIYFTTVFSAQDMPKGIANNDSRGCFITKALKNIVFSEAFMIKMDTTHKLKEKLRERIVVIAAAVLVVAILGSWIWDYENHQQRLEETKTEFNTLLSMQNTLINTHSIEKTCQFLDKLDTLRGKNKEESTYFWHLAFYKSSQRHEKIEELYYSVLENKLLPFVAQTLDTQTRANLQNYDTTWENTKAYLMLNLKEKRDPKFLKQWLAFNWSQQYANNAAIEQSLNRHWGQLIDHDFKSYEINNNTIQTARTVLAGFGQEALLYKQLKDKAMEMKLKEISFNQSMGENQNLILGGNYLVPGFFTQKGYQKIFSVDGKTLLKEIIKANWVLGFTTKIKDQDLDTVYIRIQHYYFEEYKQEWNKALFALSLAPNLTSEQVELLTSQDSPIIAILKELRKNTEIYSLLELLENKAGAAVNVKGANTQNLAVDFNAKSLRDFFKPYNQLITNEGTAGTTLQAEMTRYSNAASQASSMSEVRTPADAFSSLVAKANGAGATISEVSVLPSPVSKWLPRSMGMSTAQLIGDGKKHIQEQYKAQLYPFYRDKIAHKYPFNPSASSEVALVDFETFFGTGGMVDEFKREYISPLATLNPVGRGYKAKRINGSTVSFSPQLMEALYQASEIKRELFSGRGLGTSIYIKPNTLNKHLSNMNLQYDDGSLLYEHGPIKFRKFSWPSSTGNSDARLQMNDLNGQLVVNVNSTGQWGLFRLFGKMNQESISAEEVSTEYSSQGNKGSFILSGPASKAFGPNSPIRKFKLPGNI